MEYSKEELRQRFLARLKIDDQLRDEASKKIVEKLSQILLRAKGPVAAFCALGSEPVLKDLVNSLNLDWVFPRVEGDTMSFYRSRWDQLKPGAYRVFEPEAEVSARVQIDELSWVLVPGVSFDRNGVRLGRGKGFYDRTLQNYSGQKVGVCLNQGVSNESLPKEDHDLKMDWLVTDQFVMRPLAS